MPDAPSAITPALRSAAAGEPDDGLLDVVVELAPDPSVPRSVDALREAFAQAAAPVQEAIEGLGGSVVDGAWINRTLRARVPAGRLDAVSSLEAVRALDVPHTLKPD
jgi:hypothetical protein